MSCVCTAHGTALTTYFICPNQKFIWLTVFGLFSIFESSFRSAALMLFTLKNFQGCIVVYLSRFISAPCTETSISYWSEICFAHSIIWLFLTYGEGGIWTLAPLLTTCTLSRGVPSTTWVLLQKVDCENLFNSHQHWRKTPTERVGFEPTRPLGQTVFKTASLWPLRYFSISFLSQI